MNTVRKSDAISYMRLLRLDSWVGWLFNFALGCILSFELPPINRFVLFSLSLVSATIGIFILNQYFDRRTDRLNQLKRLLPIASGDISPRKAIFFFFLLIALSIYLVILTHINVFSLFLAYLGLWICYSMPPLRLKSRPIFDLIVAGVGSGALPFILGLQTSNQLTLDISLPWVRRRYQDALFCVIPLLLLQSAKHIYQAVGDYEADSIGHVHTFVVRYGKKTSMKVAELFIVVGAVLPIFYLGLFLTDFLHWYLIFLTCSVPGMVYVLNLLRKPSKDNIHQLQQISRKIGPVILVVVLIYACLIRIMIFP